MSIKRRVTKFSLPYSSGFVSSEEFGRIEDAFIWDGEGMEDPG